MPPPRTRHAAPWVTEKARPLLEALFPQEKTRADEPLPLGAQWNQEIRSTAARSMEPWRACGACPFLTCVFELGPSAITGGRLNGFCMLKETCARRGTGCWRAEPTLMCDGMLLDRTWFFFFFCPSAGSGKIFAAGEYCYLVEFWSNFIVSCCRQCTVRFSCTSSSVSRKSGVLCFCMKR